MTQTAAEPLVPLEPETTPELLDVAVAEPTTTPELELELAVVAPTTTPELVELAEVDPAVPELEPEVIEPVAAEVVFPAPTAEPLEAPEEDAPAVSFAPASPSSTG